MKSIKISIVLPCFNEEENINICYLNIKKILEELGHEFEIIFVNDGSNDRTLDILLDIHQKDDRVVIIELSRNFGKERALTAGLNYAQGDCIIPFDADLQHPPEIIELMVQKFLEGYDIVDAVKLKRTGENFIRSFMSNIFYWIMNKFSDVKLQKNVGDFRLLSRQALEAVLEMPERKRFIKGLFTWIGFNRATIEYIPNYRIRGKTKWNFLKLLNLAIDGIISFSTFPLRIASIIGFLISVLGIGYATFILLQKIFFDNPVKGYASTIIAILIVGGFNLIILGIIGEYIGSIYEEVKCRPIYIIKRVWKKNSK